MQSVRSALLASAAAITVSPLLAAWCDNLIHDQRTGWWRPRQVSFRRWFTVAGVAVLFAAAGSRGTPVLAWWVFAVVGAVLAIVDSKTHRLPARLVGPLAAAEAAILLAYGIAADQPQYLIRSGAATVSVTVAYFCAAIISPDAIGLGDVHVMGIASGVLGWNSWDAVILGQLGIWTFGLLLAFVIFAARRDAHRWSMPVPMGVALVGGALVTTIFGSVCSLV